MVALRQTEHFTKLCPLKPKPRTTSSRRTSLRNNDSIEARKQIESVIEERLATITAYPGVTPEDKAVVIAERADLEEQLAKSHAGASAMGEPLPEDVIAKLSTI